MMKTKKNVSKLIANISLLFGCLLIAQISNGQVFYPGDYAEEYYRVLLIKDTTAKKPIMIRPSVMTAYNQDSLQGWNIWGENFDFRQPKKNGISILNPRLAYVYNHEYPRGYNDGPVWSGRGHNSSLTGGVYGKLSIFQFSFAPVLWYAQNRSFGIPPHAFNKSEYSYPISQRLDWVMRYGDESVYQFDWGQTEARIVLKNFTLGFSTANFSWGPSRYNPIIMSKNAGGFPHVDLGTASPVDTKIGSLEFKWYWGAMSESKYFDDKSINDRKYITGFAFGYQPKYIKGLTFGINRIMYTRWAKGDLSSKDFFNAFIRNTHNDLQKNDEYDQLVSAVLEYCLPKVGLNIYIEYARNDFFGSIMDAAEHPDRTRARTIGITKTFDLASGNLLEVNYENTTLSSNQIRQIYPGISATYYIHGVVESGYTNDGQIVGAGIGPGSNSDIMWINLYSPNGKFGFTFQRIRFNDDYLVETYAGVEDEPTDYEIVIGLDYIKTFKNFSFHPQLLAAYRNNFLFEDNEKNNFIASLALSYRITK